MFGYVKPVKAEMKVKEWETYRALYCGLCKQLSSDYGFLARMTLSYDFTFLALLAAGVKPNCGGYEQKRCPVHPMQKRYCYCKGADLHYAASAEVLLVVAKLQDNCMDSGLLKKILAGILLIPMKWKRKKAALEYPKLAAATDDYLKEQNQLEREHCSSIDRAAEPTAKVLSLYFSELGQDENRKLVLSRLGYLTGRYVYLMDALDDLEEDYHSGDYNVYLERCSLEKEPDFNTIRSYAQETLNLTIGQIAEAFELLTMNRFRTILQNIVYLGFHQGIQRVLERAQKEQKKTFLERL